jgi:hypothetical protein
LASAIGTMVPSSAAAASVVGLPAPSSAQPSGIGSSLCPAAMILPRATLLTDRSITMGSAPGTGAAKAIGLVPNSACAPPQGAIAPGVLTSIIATSPWRASSSTNSPVTPA